MASSVRSRRELTVTDDVDARNVEDDADLVRLRIQARLHDGVVPVPFLGVTWQQRGAAYWRRRVGAVVLLVVLTLFVGAIAAAFTAGIIAGVGRQPAGVVVGTVYALFAVPGFIVGRRRVAKAPLDGRGQGTSYGVPVGLPRVRLGAVFRRTQRRSAAVHVRPRFHR